MRNLKRTLSCLGVVVTVAVGLVACGTQSPAGAVSTENFDPKTGWVFVTGPDHDGLYGTYVYKTCDNTTLIYASQRGNSGGVSAIPDSPECK